MKIRSDLKVRNIVDEHVVLLPSSKSDSSVRILSLNPTSFFLWEGLKGKDFVAEDAVELLLGQYDVEREVAERDVLKWIDQLKEFGALE